ncbi:MAG TPA: CarD family transcriptional regulator, partial [Gammaproteobacteria bacterium]
MPASSSLLSLPTPTAAQPVIAWRGLHGAAVSLALAEALSRAQGTVVIVAQTAARAEQLLRELAFFASDIEIASFPDYETLPYEAISPPKDLLADRLSVLYKLAAGDSVKLVVNAEALLGRLPPADFVLSHSLDLSVGEEIDRDALTAKLVEHGYLRVSQVAEPGEIAVRGAVIDIYPAGSKRAVRIDLFDREIESLRLFDPETQVADTEHQRVSILPAREFPFDEAAIRHFRQRFREEFPVEPGRCPVYRDISDAQLPAGIEYYLPLFLDRTVSLLDYLPADSLILICDGALDGLIDAEALIRDRYEQMRHDTERPVLGPEAAFHSPDGIRRGIDDRPSVRLTGQPVEGVSEVADARSAHPLAGGVVDDANRITRWIEAGDAERSLVVASSAGRREVLLELLRSRGYEVSAASGWRDFIGRDDALMVAAGELDDGLSLPAAGIRIVTAEQLGLERPRQQSRRRSRAKDPESIIRELSDLQIGAPVVHEQHGVGRYQGLTTLDVDGVETEFLLLEYADGDKLYV